MGKYSINGPFSMAMLNNQMVTWQCIRVHPIFGQPPSHRLCLKQRLRLRNNPAGHGLGFTSESGESNFMMLHRMAFEGKIYGQSFQRYAYFMSRLMLLSPDLV
jgi:hypothetical protein